MALKKNKEKGTILKIEGLKDKWSEASIKRVFKYIGDILQPFPLQIKQVISISADGSVNGKYEGR